MSESLVDDPRLVGLMLREAWRRLGRLVRAPLSDALQHLAAERGDPPPLSRVPPNLRPGRTLQAQALMAGRFELGAGVLDCGDASPFAMAAPSPAFARELHAFGWLGDLAGCEAAGLGLPAAGAEARFRLAQWLAGRRSAGTAAAREPETAARRLIAWLTHAGFLLSGADAAFSRAFLRALAREAALLRRMGPAAAPDGLPRLRVAAALCLAALCLPAGRHRRHGAARLLAAELDRQIFADGGHVSRNPAALAEILADVLPMRTAFTEAGQPMPKALYSAIDRMLPALRFFRHGDGALALFNGAGAVDGPFLAGILRHDETMGEPISNARQSGYQRLSAGGTLILADTGPPPAPSLSAQAHAGTLALEFSSLGQRIVVGCGAPGEADEGWRRAARSTAAHSTLTLGERSSARFPRHRGLDRFLGTPLVAGPTGVAVEREDEDGALTFRAAHDGYRAAFGLLHERRVSLSPGGHRIEGIDRLAEAGRCATRERRPATIRFHLHPAVLPQEEPGVLRLRARGHSWLFSATVAARIEESILFAGRSGPQPTSQIVLDFDADRLDTVFWSFQRVTGA